MPLSLNAGPTGPPSSVRIPDLGAPPSTVHPSHLADGPTPPTLSAPPPLLFTPGLASPQRTPIRSLFDSPRHRPARLRRRPSVRLSRFRPHHRSPHHHPTPQHSRRGVGRCLPPPNPPPPRCPGAPRIHRGHPGAPDRGWPHSTSRQLPPVEEMPDGWRHGKAISDSLSRRRQPAARPGKMTRSRRVEEWQGPTRALRRRAGGGL